MNENEKGEGGNTTQKRVTNLHELLFVSSFLILSRIVFSRLRMIFMRDEAVTRVSPDWDESEDRIEKEWEALIWWIWNANLIVDSSYSFMRDQKWTSYNINFIVHSNVIYWRCNNKSINPYCFFVSSGVVITPAPCNNWHQSSPLHLFLINNHVILNCLDNKKMSQVHQMGATNASSEDSRISSYRRKSDAARRMQLEMTSWGGMGWAWDINRG